MSQTRLHTAIYMAGHSLHTLCEWFKFKKILHSCLYTIYLLFDLLIFRESKIRQWKNNSFLHQSFISLIVLIYSQINDGKLQKNRPKFGMDMATLELYANLIQDLFETGQTLAEISCMLQKCVLEDSVRMSVMSSYRRLKPTSFNGMPFSCWIS